jgi:hypothetical protein
MDRRVGKGAGGGEGGLGALKTLGASPATGITTSAQLRLSIASVSAKALFKVYLKDVKRIKLEFALGVETEFVDRDRALAQVVEWAERGTRFPVVIFGPEGCGKTAFLQQASVMLRELGYDVFYLHPLDRVFEAEVDDADVKSLFADLVRKTLEDERWGRLALAVFDLTREILKKRRRKIAIIADDVFQAIGLDKAAAYVKGLLNMIEHPVYRYENIVVLVATSEGVRDARSGDISGPNYVLCGTCRRRASASCTTRCRNRSPPSRMCGGGLAETRECSGGFTALDGLWGGLQKT